MKKILSKSVFIMVVLALLSALSLSAGAVENKIVWSQNFDNVSSFDDLNWPFAEGLAPKRGNWEVKGGKLHVNTIGVNDAYVLMIPESFMKDIVKDDYTLQYDVVFLDTNPSDGSRQNRFVSIVHNYDAVTGAEFNMITARIGGQFHWRARVMDYPAAGLNWLDVCDTIDRKGPDSISQKIFNIPYTVDDLYLKDKLMTYRIEVSNKNRKIEFYINDILYATNSQEVMDNWLRNANKYSAMAIWAMTNIEATIDNIVLATGLGIPDETATTTTASATTTAASSATTTTTPATGGYTLLLASALALITSVSVVAVRKSRRHSA